MLKISEISFLCPICSLMFETSQLKSKELGQNKFLLCENGHEFPIINGMPRLLDEKECSQNNPNKKISINNYQKTSTLESFNFHYGLKDWIFKYDVERVGNNLKNVFRIGPDTLKGKTVFIIGCGNGSEIKVISEYNPEMIIAIDLTDTIEDASRNICDVQNVLIIQADAHQMILPNNYVDIVYCDGVLPHTKNPHKVIENMIDLIKPGGVIYFRTMLETSLKRNMFYVLPRKTLRLFLSRLDSKLLWDLCYLFGMINNIPVVNYISRKLFLYHDPQNNNINVTRLMNFRRYGKHSFRHRLKKEDIMNTIISKNKNVNISVFNNVFMVSA
jgi:ubiquinone/menaquinone biosynthesis C-methylase UbiE